MNLIGPAEGANPPPAPPVSPVKGGGKGSKQWYLHLAIIGAGILGLVSLTIFVMIFSGHKGIFIGAGFFSFFAIFTIAIVFWGLGKAWREGSKPHKEGVVTKTDEEKEKTEPRSSTSKPSRLWGMINALIFLGVMIFLIAVVLNSNNGQEMMKTFKETRRVDTTFRPNVLADNADADVIDARKLMLLSESNRFILQNIPEGAWGQVIVLPESFRSGWCYQPYPLKDAENPDWRIAFDFVNPNRTSFGIAGPFWWGERPYFDFGTRPMMFRLQGHVPHGILFERGYRDSRNFCVP